MKKQILFIVSLLLISCIYSSRTINISFAQSQENTPIPDFPQQNQTKEIPENIAYNLLFGMIDSFEKEAQKQESQGYAKRAETLRNAIQKKLELTARQSG